jgi:dephospho-CoA kinase
MIVGITGTNGAGKGTVVDLLKDKGFAHYSASAFISEEVIRRGLPLDRDSMREVGNDLRRTHGASYIVETLYAQALQQGGNAIIESIREIAGAAFLKEQGAFLLVVDADRRLRYERAVLRGTSKDRVTFEEFCEQEDKEMDKAASFEQDIRRVMQMADFRIENNGSVEDLGKRVDEIYRAMCQ